MTLNEPLEPHTARRQILWILENGRVRFSRHAEEEMRTDRILRADVLGVLRGGFVQPAEHRSGSWRYEVRTQQLSVVIVFRTAGLVVVVTAWRMKR